MLNHITELISIYTYQSDKSAWHNVLPDNINIISYQLDGSYDHFFEFGKLGVKEDHIFNIAPNMPYSVQRVKKGTSVCVSFTSDRPIKTELIDCSGDPRFSILFHKLLNYKSLGIKSNYYTALSIIYEIMSLMEEKSSGNVQNFYHRNIFSETYDFLLSNFSDSNLNVSEFSKKSGLSDKYFRETFKKIYGSTPTQLLINLRLNEAAKLLSVGYLSITQVAEAVGFNDVYYFSRLFKKKFSVSPSQFEQ